MATIGGKITELRKVNNVSQDQLAAVLQVSKQTVYNWESGKSEPTLKNIDGLCRFFSVNADFFICGSTQTAQTTAKQAAATEQEAAKQPLTQEERDALTEEIAKKVAGEIKHSNKCKLLLLAACLSIIAFVILAALIVIFGFIVFTTNKGGIDSFSTTPVSNAEYGIIVFFAVVFLALSVLFMVLYIKNKKHK